MLSPSTRFSDNTINQVVDRILEMNKNSSLMSMGALQRALSKDEDLQFRQAMQLTTCLNPRPFHSRMHDEGALYAMPLTITHNGPV